MKPGITISYQGTPVRFERDYDADAEFRKDHAAAAKFALDVSVTNYLRLIRVPNEACEKCVAEIHALLRNYEPS